MTGTHAWMTALTGVAVALFVAAWPGVASAVDPDELAAPGACAEELREIRRGPAQPGGVDQSSTTIGLARVHVTPIDVAAGPTAIAGPRPIPPSFTGPGPCDSPGSGCLGPVLPAASAATLPTFGDPNPGGGCNFPGCQGRPAP